MKPQMDGTHKKEFLLNYLNRYERKIKSFQRISPNLSSMPPLLPITKSEDTTSPQTYQPPRHCYQNYVPLSVASEDIFTANNDININTRCPPVQTRFKPNQTFEHKPNHQKRTMPGLTRIRPYQYFKQGEWTSNKESSNIQSLLRNLKPDPLLGLETIVNEEFKPQTEEEETTKQTKIDEYFHKKFKISKICPPDLGSRTEKRH